MTHIFRSTLPQRLRDMIPPPAVTTLYVAAGSSANPNCVAWGRNDTLCYGCRHAVVVADPTHPPKIHSTLPGHTADVINVSYIDNRSTDTRYDAQILSTSADNTAIVWNSHERMMSKYNYRQVAMLECHSASVFRGCGITCQSNGVLQTFIALASSDDTVSISVRINSDDMEAEFVQISRFTYDRGYVLALQWMLLDATPVLVCGDDRGTLLFYAPVIEKGGYMGRGITFIRFSEVLSLKVHEDWIRDIAIYEHDDGSVLVATSSQDCTIRIHRLERQRPLDVADADLIVRPVTTLTLGDNDVYTLILESVLLGHENWVYSLNWRPLDGKDPSELCLLSSSMDKSIIIWKVESESSLWVEHVRMGDVGGNSLGYVGAVWSRRGDTVVSQAFDGSLQIWAPQSGDDATWQPRVTMGGHVEPVKDLVWQPVKGAFLLTASSDQTVRLHGQWSTCTDQLQHDNWYEFSRPQIHGYNMQSVAMLNQFSMITAGEEKIIRVFGATRNFLENFERLTGEVLMDDDDRMSKLPEGASIPALGLSNKAQEGSGPGPDAKGDSTPAAAQNNYVEQYFQSLHLDEPPTMTDLTQNTLWPEQEKLYAHGYNVYSLAAHPGGELIASSCKATDAQHASIILWSTDTWRPLQHLTGHCLTVTGLSFSHCGHFLLSVSRDRTWAMYRRAQGGGDLHYDVMIQTDKRTSGHSRILWGGCWSHDDHYFCTVSRDKKVNVWKAPSEEGKIPKQFPLLMKSSITAVNFAPILLPNNRYLLALAEDIGVIHLYSFDANKENDHYEQLYTLYNSEAHQATVTKVQFRPMSADDHSGILLLASCSDDYCVKIHEINIQNLLQNLLINIC